MIQLTHQTLYRFNRSVFVESPPHPNGTIGTSGTQQIRLRTPNHARDSVLVSLHRLRHASEIQIVQFSKNTRHESEMQRCHVSPYSHTIVPTADDYCVQFRQVDATAKGHTPYIGTPDLPISVN